MPKHLITTRVPASLTHAAAHCAACTPDPRDGGLYLALAQRLAAAPRPFPPATAEIPSAWDPDWSAPHWGRSIGPIEVPVVALTLSEAERVELAHIAERDRESGSESGSFRHAAMSVCDWLLNDAQHVGMVTVVDYHAQGALELN